jgi:hypothetical protein
MAIRIVRPEYSTVLQYVFQNVIDNRHRTERWVFLDFPGVRYFLHCTEYYITEIFFRNIVTTQNVRIMCKKCL